MEAGFLRYNSQAEQQTMSAFFKQLPSSSTPLGHLERRLLKLLWSRGNATVRELLEEANLGIAYTMVMTTLDRLYKKRLLNRAAEGRAFRYTPRVTEAELQSAAAGEAIRQLLHSASASSLPLSYLVEAVSQHDSQLLDELQALVERKRQEVQKKYEER